MKTEKSDKNHQETRKMWNKIRESKKKIEQNAKNGAKQKKQRCKSLKKIQNLNRCIRCVSIFYSTKQRIIRSTPFHTKLTSLKSKSPQTAFIPTCAAMFWLIGWWSSTQITLLTNLKKNCRLDSNAFSLLLFFPKTGKTPITKTLQLKNIFSYFGKTIIANFLRFSRKNSFNNQSIDHDGLFNSKGILYD